MCKDGEQEFPPYVLRCGDSPEKPQLDVRFLFYIRGKRGNGLMSDRARLVFFLPLSLWMLRTCMVYVAQIDRWDVSGYIFLMYVR